MDDLMNHCIVFADMSSELMTLHHLLKHSLIIGMAGFLLLLAISIWLSGLGGSSGGTGLETAEAVCGCAVS